MNNIKTFLLILAITFSLNGFAQNNNLSKQALALIEEFNSRLKSNSENKSVGSISAALIVGDTIAWEKSYGFVDKEQKVPASTNTIYSIGSISKSVTGIALARLVQKGILKLDEPAEKYVPEIRNIKGLLPDVSITIRQLATHTSGLSRETELPDAAEGSIKVWEEKLLASISMTTFDSGTYKKYSYSNIGYGILGLAMSRAAKKPFDKLIDEIVFKPLKMKNSHFELTPVMQKNLAVAYDSTHDYNLGRGYKVPNGGVYSCATDMVNFAKAQLHTKFPSFLNDSIWNQVQTFQVVSKEIKDEKYGYGLGVSVWTDKAKKNWIYHNGTLAPGYSASLYCDVTAKIAIVILRNDKGSDDIAGIADEFLYRFGDLKSTNALFIAQ